MGSTLSGLISLVTLALDIWAIVNILKSTAETAMKIIWVLVIIVLPVLGLIIWAIAGPRGNVRL
ncbi:PLD nuclease N-terminal domain-containing protein [Pseudomonas aeruginosa]|uniref:PLD nuclease N-terminal domain-containing protein n=1 Tax=Pseudomonas aeruginosa TaxID=287 RepID=UPI0018C6EB31|nr:PLD nuclease N-terminal domain-containing protein [Pseudomonas aeruginosa]MBG4569048.1 PLDc_N domain-containing protein [Pseudomonas aeruginosa]MDM1418530.1 PLDc_N domain-containing protein [Pseudomonas aeruginosa]MDM1429304.1 PLDc_N domain-containing protein [Pseudomonas aeruginosa]MDM1437271.1 PLDc_N domain-containing protein [Pseudomonas aeruginosa]